MNLTTLRVPASSANLGPGFDALAMALSLYLDFSFETHDDSVARVAHAQVDHMTANPPMAFARDADERHLAIRTFRSAGGIGSVRVAANFAGGRGLGFSGAARLAGVLAARLQQGDVWDAASTEALRVANELEGHADNVAASLYGGIVAVAVDSMVSKQAADRVSGLSDSLGSTDGNPAVGTRGKPHVVQVPLGCEANVVVWIPNSETSTKSSRARLATTVEFDDAVFNVGRSAMFVAALASGDTAALRFACQDRLHQPQRFAQAPEALCAYEHFLAGDAWCAWLSGSGPSVAALCDPGLADTIAATMPSSGRAVVCNIDTEGTRYL